VNRFQFVEGHQDAYCVKRLCQVVEIARSSFYAWLAAAPRRSVRAAADEVLAERIRVLQDRIRAGIARMVRRGSRVISMTASPPMSGSTASGSSG